MFTPGYDEENKTKPQIVKDIESADDGLTADQAALALYKGVYRFFCSLTWLTFLFYRCGERTSTYNRRSYHEFVLRLHSRCCAEE